MPRIGNPGWSSNTPSVPSDNRADPDVWGALAHPQLQAHNPFFTQNGYGHPTGKAQSWRDPDTGWAVHPQSSPAAGEHLRKMISTATPAIAANTESLRRILQEGRLKSQLETGTGSGGSDTQEQDARREVEHFHFGYPHNFPAHARPIYGYLTHHPDRPHEGVQGYGEHTIVLDPQRVGHRTSAIVGDTYNHEVDGNDVSSHPMHDFKLSGYSMDGEEGRPVPHPQQYSIDHSSDAIPYTEAHIHGGVSLADIHHVVFHRPPEPEMERALSQRGVPWVHMERGQPIRRSSTLTSLMAQLLGERSND